MKLNELRYFIAVAEERHFGRAAQKCFISQPALSIGIKNLEISMETTLFERTTNEVLLTPAGEKALPLARQVLGLISELEAINIDENSLEGELKLGIIFTIAPYLLPRVIPSLREMAPELFLNIYENMTENLIPMLKTGVIDAAIMSLPIPDSTFEIIDLYEEDFYVIAAKSHPIAKRKSIDAAEVHDHNPLLLNVGHCFRDQVIDQCKEINPSQSHHHSLETIRNIVATGHDISVLPEYAITQDRVGDLLAYIPFKKPIPKRRVVLAYRKEFSQKRKVEIIAETIRALKL